MLGRFVRAVVYPAVLLAAVGGAAALIGAGASAPVVVAGVNVATAVIIAALERALPYRPTWNRSHGDTRTDVLHMIFGMLPIPVIFRAVALGAMVAASGFLAARLGGPLWPSQLPMALQVVVALVVAELGQYWVHRLAHERAALWRLHVVHHSVERLYWLNAGRFHPADTLLQHAGQIAPLVLLGANDHVLALFTVFTSANGLLRHANVDARSGWLSWVLSTAELHRWHHSLELEESNANYGANLILWDVVFGTRKAPQRPGPDRLGLAHPFPRGFLAQLTSPLRAPDAHGRRGAAG